MTIGDMSRRWHKAAGLVAREEAVVIPGEEHFLRRMLIAEEQAELLEAMKTASLPRGAEPVPAISGITQQAVAEVAGELADLVVVLYGTADHYGIDLDRAVALKHEANMAKLPDCPECGATGVVGPTYMPEECGRCDGRGKGEPRRREDGKVLKPDGWEQPDMRLALRRG